MATRQDERMIEPDMNPQDLWLEEIFTDRRVGTIRRMTPVKGDGTPDAGRQILRHSETEGAECRESRVLALVGSAALLGLQ